MIKNNYMFVTFDPYLWGFDMKVEFPKVSFSLEEKRDVVEDSCLYSNCLEEFIYVKICVKKYAK